MGEGWKAFWILLPTGAVEVLLEARSKKLVSFSTDVFLNELLDASLDEK